MEATELQEIKDYWKRKYPHVLVNLWINKEGDKYFGMMMAGDQDVHLASDTFGELINQGEKFLRRVAQCRQ